MGQVRQETFVCIDCEATGLDLEKDKIIEIAAAKFNFDTIFDTYDTLIDPECSIPDESQAIHHISQSMVFGKPKIKEILPTFLNFIGKYIIVGHGINFDLTLITNAAKTNQIPCDFSRAPVIDTLRLARLYGESPINSLEKLGKHFNVEQEGAHRAMTDVLLNIEVFKHLASFFSTTEDLLARLKKPILLKAMPLGKHKGRKFSDIPLEYLQWAADKDFDQDLLFSIRTEINNRKKGKNFKQSCNPFQNL
ncbi:MAG: DUF3820 family protein [Chlamydiae bacterium]|nr:DUF3820 family protein [Chlamydiota bacterium]